jgi:RimJ/RimL family protein N-acetyltransferase
VTDLDAVTLELRSVTHAEALFALLVDPGLYEFLDEEPPVSVEALRHKLARSESRKSPDGSEHWLNWVVRDQSSEVAGYVQATIAANGDTNVAYVIGRAFWGRGLALRAVREMLHIVETQFEPRRFIVIAEKANTRSLRLAQRLGFATCADPDLMASKRIGEHEVLLQKRARRSPDT